MPTLGPGRLIAINNTFLTALFNFLSRFFAALAEEQAEQEDTMAFVTEWTGAPPYRYIDVSRYQGSITPEGWKKVKAAGYDETSESNTVKYYALKMQDGSGFTWQGMHQVGLSGFGVDEVVEMTINCIFTKKPEFSETLTVTGG